MSIEPSETVQESDEDAAHRGLLADLVANMRGDDRALFDLWTSGAFSTSAPDDPAMAIYCEYCIDDQKIEACAAPE